MKGSFCVSTVSFVGRPDPGSMAVVSGCTDWPRRPFVRPGIVIIVADADGADGIFEPLMNPDHPGSSSAFTTEGNLNAEHAKKRLRTTQPPSKQSWIFGKGAYLTQAGEKLIEHARNLLEEDSRTQVMMRRFGNVDGSAGLCALLPPNREPSLR
jgi:hypothetical protein